MKIIKTQFAALLLGLLCFLSAPAQEKSDRDRCGLIGPVKTIHFEVAKFLNESRKEGPRVSSCRFTYDPNGELIEDTRYFEGRRQTRSYEKKEGATEETGYDATGSLENKTVYAYNSDGKVIEEGYYDGKGILQYKKVYNYRGPGNVVDVATYTEGGSKFDGKQSYRYDDNRGLTENASYGPDGTLRLKQTYAYNDKKLLTETARYNRENHLLIKTTYRYDDRERLIVQAEYKRDGSLQSQTVFVYNSRTNIVEQSNFTTDGSLDNRRTSNYDDKGNLTEEAGYGADGMLDEKNVYSYKFDSRGNWTKQTKSKWVANAGRSRLEPIEATYRTIVYY
jgi:hypothetical protein